MTASPDGATLADHTVVAHNTATESTNKIHDDAVAQAYGFRGGLVPGVDVYAYMTHIPVREWGRAWLEQGTMAARFVTPVYDGHTVTVSGTQDGDALGGRGARWRDGVRHRTRRAGRAGSRTAGAARRGPAGPPTARLRCRAASGHRARLDRRGVRRCRAPRLPRRRARTAPLYAAEGIAHPGWVLRFANRALSANVVLGPWIHVSSDLALLGTVADGATVEARSVVVDEFSRKGHRFVTLDVAIGADGRPVQRIVHTAIYEPRRREP